MAISVFDIFKIGVGPSSSHTIGPMLAACFFANELKEKEYLHQTATLKVQLYGSLAATGMGHCTDKAIYLGLEGHSPKEIDPDYLENRYQQIRKEHSINILDNHRVPFSPKTDLVLFRTIHLPEHPNGLEFIALNQQGDEVLRKTYFSIGGGQVVSQDDFHNQSSTSSRNELPFQSAQELLDLCEQKNASISKVMEEYELQRVSPEELKTGLAEIWQAMQKCIQRGVAQKGTLPGRLNVKRRAPELFQKLDSKPRHPIDPLSVLDWVNLYALAVNEENAAGSKVVTAPTNGAAGIIPAVLSYYYDFIGKEQSAVEEFLLTAAAIGILYAQNASISGAEVGCQGEVGVACSMAAGALAAVMGGDPDRVEQAAEIGMEHNLGLTCDPIGGLVQIPCIERNAMGAIKAINAARIALNGNGHHYVSLDSVIKTMRQTGLDMKTKYKETSRGGLAVNVTEC